VMNISVPEGSPKEIVTKPRSISCTVPIQKSSNPFRNINFDVSKGQIIILHPPVQDFRPSKYSFNLNDVEVPQSPNVDGSKKC